MNKTIADLFPKTKDAMLVEEWFGAWIGGNRDSNPIFKVLLKGKEEELLKEAQRLEEARKK